MAFAMVIYGLSGMVGPGVKENLQGFQTLWGQLLSVTTFTLTFFVNQSYALWRKCYSLSRRLQGRLNDLGMTLAAHAERKTPASPSEPSSYTAGSKQLLDLISRYIRLFNLLTYASFTRSHRPILTPRGMRRLVERGLLTPGERQALVEAEVPATQRHNAVIIWVIRCFMEGRQAGHFAGGAGFEQQFLEKIHVIRAQYGGIGDELQGRMPLAYAHIVQVLVDVILWMYPVMAYANGMSPLLGILGTGLLTMSYQGLFDLAKQFLDPYDNENYGKGDDPLCVDTLIAESNAGSVRWLNGFNMMPFSSQRIKDGELFDYLLPIRGYSVEELAQMEEEKIKKEREQLEKREREEQEREEAERARIAEERKIKRLNELINATGTRQMNAALKSTLFTNATSVTSIRRTTAPSNATADSPDATAAETDDDDEELVVPEEAVVQKELVDIVSETEKDDELEIPTKPGDRVSSLGDGEPVVQSKHEANSESTTISAATQSVSPSSNQTETAPQLQEMANATDLAGATLAAAVTLATATAEREEKAREEEDSALSSPSASIPTVEAESVEEEEPPAILGVTPDMLLQPDFNFFDMANGDARWFDEMGEDGQEYRLSQMMAEEKWEEEVEYEEEQKRLEPPMSFEEYKDSVAELMEDAAAELQETRDILGSSSSADVEPARRRKQMPLKYDQTRLDGISQLWGLPPNDLSDLEVIEAPSQVTEKENSFDTIMTLWGKPPGEPTAETEISVGGNSFRGMSDLWEQNGSGDFSELPWMNEIDSDGKEFRLSEMLANEEWESPEPQVVEAPLSLEDYSKVVNEAVEDVEKEWKETEAILNAKPGAHTIKYVEEEEESNDPDMEETSDVEEATDASSEIRAEVQAALEAAKEEEEKIEQQLEMRSKQEEDSLALLLDGSEEGDDSEGDVAVVDELAEDDELANGDELTDGEEAVDDEEAADGEEAAESTSETTATTTAQDDESAINGDNYEDRPNETPDLVEDTSDDEDDQATT